MTPKLPRCILYLTDFFPQLDKGQQALIDKFVGILEVHLGVKKTVFSIAERWDEDPPEEAKGQSLAEYTVKVKLLLPCEPLRLTVL